jgi:hypothetical protein
MREVDKKNPTQEPGKVGIQSYRGLRCGRAVRGGLPAAMLKSLLLRESGLVRDGFLVMSIYQAAAC